MFHAQHTNNHFKIFLKQELKIDRENDIVIDCRGLPPEDYSKFPVKIK